MQKEKEQHAKTKEHITEKLEGTATQEERSTQKNTRKKWKDRRCGNIAYNTTDPRDKDSGCKCKTGFGTTQRKDRSWKL